MLKGLYTIHTGLRNEQNRMDIMTNNLANASTVGFKKEGSTSQAFGDIFAYKVKDTSVGVENIQRIGVNNPGVKIGENYTDIAVNSVAYPVVRDANAVMLTGSAAETSGEALRYVYSLGILDAEEGVLDAGHRMTRGESLEAAYRLVYSAIPIAAAKS
jgi:flagellar basal body rod protein FlgB